MLKVIICDDEIYYVKEIENMINEYAAINNEEFNIKCYTDPKIIIETESNFDIIFLDIEMPKINGIQLAEKLKSVNENLIIFFITNYEGYLDDAFDVNALRYLYKPIDKERLFRSIDVAKKRISKKNNYIILHNLGKEVRQNPDEIMYVTICERKCFLYTTSGEKIVEDKIGSIYEQLSNDKFVYSHKSYIVNLMYVNKYDNQSVILKYKEILYNVHMSRRMYPEFKRKFTLFARGWV